MRRRRLLDPRRNPSVIALIQLVLQVQEVATDVLKHIQDWNYPLSENQAIVAAKKIKFAVFAAVNPIRVLLLPR